MNETCRIVVVTHGHERLNRAVQTMAFQKGYRWNDCADGRLVKEDKAYCYFFTQHGRITWSGTSPDPAKHGECVKLSVEDFAKLEKWKPPYPPIRIWGQQVALMKNGDVIVGCETILSETVQTIIDRREKVMG